MVRPENEDWRAADCLGKRVLTRKQPELGFYLLTCDGCVATITAVITLLVGRYGVHNESPEYARRE